MATFHAPSLASETLGHIGSFPIRNSMVMAWGAMLVLIIIALVFKAKYKKDRAPKGFANLVESFIGGLYDFFQTIVQDHKKTRRFFPVIATIFLFVITSNWMGILPGVGSIGIYVDEKAEEQVVAPVTEEVAEPESETFTLKANVLEEGHDTVAEPETVVIGKDGQITEAAVSEAEEHEEGPELIHIFRTGFADVNMTLALAIISVVMTQYYGMRLLGFGGYWGKFFVNPFKDPIGTFVGILEFIGELSRLISYSFRLFGNIFAGEVLLVVISFLAPFIAPLPFYGLEIFVGFVQALVFALLTTVFMNLATTSHHAEPEAAH